MTASSAGRFDQALECLSDLSVEDAFVIVVTAAASLTRTDPDAALALYDQAITLRPDQSGPMNNKAILLAQLGQIDQATNLLCNAIALSPHEPMLYYNYGIFGRFSTGHPFLTALERLDRDAPSLQLQQRIHLKFALSKAADDLGRHDIAMRHLLEGNALKRSQIAYDAGATTGLVERIRAVFSRYPAATEPDPAGDAPSPCFILSMPRSGSTLVEQILSGHPDVLGLGEIGAFAAGVHRTPTISSQSYPELVPSLSGADFRRISDSYRANLPVLPPGCSTIVDKSLDNIWYAGLIHLTLPHARFIHVIRNPVDTCLSCFSNLFSTDVPYAYDLEELGRYYRDYKRLMEHWTRFIPPDRLTEVHYEDLVADPECHARRLLSFCGLSWSSTCLDLKNNRRAVRTASAAQVRRPIYKTSVDRWKVSDASLRPLLQALSAP